MVCNYYSVEVADEVCFNTIEKRITSIVELINFIHSIDRINYVNSISNFYITDHNVTIQLSEFSIVLYKNNTITFSINTAESHNKKVALDELSKIYEVINNNFTNEKEYYSYLIIKDNMWKFGDKIPNNSLVGLNLSLSNSVYFIRSEQYEELKYVIKGMNYNGDIYNINQLNKLIGEDFECESYYYTFDGDLRNKELVIEFLIYTNYIYNTLLVLYNDILYNYDKFDKNNNYIGFDIRLSFTIKCRCIGLDSCSEISDTLTLSNLESPKNFLSKIISKIL
jgi:hypothetical protein